jgi:MFS family permease
MICGANSDLFGRRWFILGGNILVFVGAIVAATSHHVGQTIAAHVLIGFGGGNCQLAAFAIPELLPNKWRHIGVVIADGVAFFCVIAGPVTARIAIRHGDAVSVISLILVHQLIRRKWRWGYWAMVIFGSIVIAILVLFYYPPKHPRGIPWGQAIRNLDYFGIVSFTAAAAMILSGIVYVQLLPSNDPKVIGLLVAGFACLIFFGLWETFAPLKEPLTPTRLFTKNKGRTLTAPFIVGFVVTMFYFGTNIIWGTMVSVYFTTATTPAHTVYWLATVQGFGILLGGMILSFGGSYFRHWKWQMVISITFMTFFGGLLAYVTPEREGTAIAFAFLSATAFGYAQYLSITYIQFGADQIELGIAGGLAGVARESGGAVAVTTFQTILVNVQKNYAAKHVVMAAEAAGASPKVAQAVAAALPLGAAALEKVQGQTMAIVAAAGAAFIESYVQGLK